MGKKVFPYVIDNSIDIHSLADIELAKYLIKKINEEKIKQVFFF